MSNTFIRGAISCSATTSYTGSFVKLQAVHETFLQDFGTVKTQGGHTASLANITWGQWPDDSDIGSNGVDSGAGGGVNGGSIKVNVGDTIEGNIYSFKTETNGGGWLAYYKKK